MEPDMSSAQHQNVYFPTVADFEDLMPGETLPIELGSHYGRTDPGGELDTTLEFFNYSNHAFDEPFQHSELDLSIADLMDQYNCIRTNNFNINGMVTAGRNDQDPTPSLSLLDQVVHPESPPMLERYLSDSSEDESADINDIKTAAKVTRPNFETQTFGPSPTAAIRTPLEIPIRGPHSRPGSVDGISVGSGGGISVGSGISAASGGSVGSFISLSGRRKSILRFQPRNQGPETRKPHPYLAQSPFLDYDRSVEAEEYSLAQCDTGDQLAYECTFCLAKFKTQGNWARHEESIHLVLNKWICAPEGYMDPVTGNCVYCNHIHEAVGWTNCNRTCAAKDIEARTFCRKGHLQQHLKGVHYTGWRDVFNNWQQRFSPPETSRCGFCDRNFDSWHWDGDWGFSKDWMERLDGAILPRERSETRFTEDDDKELLRLRDVHRYSYATIGYRFSQAGGGRFEVDDLVSRYKHLKKLREVNLQASREAFARKIESWKLQRTTLSGIPTKPIVPTPPVSDAPNKAGPRSREERLQAKKEALKKKIESLNLQKATSSDIPTTPMSSTPVNEAHPKPIVPKPSVSDAQNKLDFLSPQAPIPGWLISRLKPDHGNKEDISKDTYKRKRHKICTKPTDAPHTPGELISQHTRNIDDDGGIPVNSSRKKQRLNHRLPVVDIQQTPAPGSSGSNSTG
ncbi:hypothetical protein K440DRAFT_659761 [Wilcoxina mikolae CBS 423.85]|nr:hypothetical protein K440DRAFT_659761 [Wilcoxina mikolae CBS 423.85]